MPFAKFKIDEPGGVDMTLTLTMNLAQWQKLKEQLGNRSGVFEFPASAVCEQINAMVAQATEHFTKVTEES
jgi:hypothetical protein